MGASSNPNRYSYLAIQRLRSLKHPVVGIGKRVGKVSDVEIITDHPPFEAIDTVTVYLSALHQKQYYEYIMSLHPRRIIFNPGAENDVLSEMADKNGIKTLEACTLVLLSTGQY